MSGGYASGDCAVLTSVLALKQGNLLRGQALVRMAVKDGDGRCDGALYASMQNGGKFSEETVDVVLDNQAKVN